ncbi:MAG: glycoside hydrolase family 32 protein [Ancrocorticia sp.]|uniref:glycoside hydrolase family 32 protein n=1 Tax=Ancrocorticia sp. TaxID=2593684 RepID=UPI003F90E3C9
MAHNLTDEALSAMRSSRAADDPDYPLFHVAPPVGRLNDPNGLARADGVYHAFYQFSPFHPHRKLVYWGHATSRDMLTWDHHAPAIMPDSRYDRHGAYSGTAFFIDDDGEASSPVALFYTGNVKDEETGIREASQCLVTSPDFESFTKYPGNPVIPGHPAGYTPHFRDPQVWRSADGSYRMLIGAQREDETGAALFYRSADLISWECEGEMSFPDAGGAFDRFGYMWECPNLISVSDEVTGEAFDVLIFCPQGIHPDREGFENIFPCVYIVGHLDGTQFRGTDGTYTELDHGFEFYAPQVFATPAGTDETPLLMGWAGNASEDDQPSIDTGGWGHTLTVPRKLSLRAGRLIQRPAIQLPRVSVDHGQMAPSSSKTIRELEGSRAFELGLNASDSGVEVRIGSDEQFVSIQLAGNTLIVDRSTSRYPHGKTRRVTLPEGCERTLRILHDSSITEVFVGDGDIAFTLRSFVDGDGLTVRTHGGSRPVTVTHAGRFD